MGSDVRRDRRDHRPYLLTQPSHHALVAGEPVKVAFNARTLGAASLRGFNRYTVNLLSHLAERGVELLLCSDRAIHETHLQRLPESSFQVRLATGMPYLRWEQAWLPRQCAADGADLLHSPINFGLPWSSSCPRVLTLHDAFGQGDSLWQRGMNADSVKSALYHWMSRTRADRVITVSEYSRSDLISKLGIAAERISVVHEAADPIFSRPIASESRSAVRAKYDIPVPYVLYVGGWEERKNVRFLIQAFSQANLGEVRLILGGGLDDQRQQLVHVASAAGVQDRVQMLGWIDEEDLPALYAEALGFVYPSRHEGFGLQLCEAMAAGCPTLAANATSLPEVLGDGGECFGLDDPAQLAALLCRLAGDAEYRRSLRARALARSSRFSWSRTAEATMQVYAAAIDAGVHRS